MKKRINVKANKCRFRIQLQIILIIKYELFYTFLGYQLLFSYKNKSNNFVI